MFKRLQLGTLVGKRTWGGLVAKGHDPQLEAAVAIAMEKLKGKPAHRIGPTRSTPRRIEPKDKLATGAASSSFERQNAKLISAMNVRGNMGWRP